MNISGIYSIIDYMLNYNINLFIRYLNYHVKSLVCKIVAVRILHSLFYDKLWVVLMLGKWLKLYP